MTVKISSGLRDFMLKLGSVDDGLRNGRIEIRDGAQPASADAAAIGTLLCTITNAAGSLTNEVLATGTVTLTGGSSGSVNTITVDGVEIMGAAVAFTSTLSATAAAVAAQINRYKSNPNYWATSVGAVITIHALPGTGTDPNTLAVVTGVTTITKTDVDMSGGVAAVNGLKFDFSSGGTMAKLATQTWQGTNVANGTAGWCRVYGSEADDGTLDSTGLKRRMDGSVATAGAQLNVTSTAFASGAPTVPTSFSVTMPAQ